MNVSFTIEQYLNKLPFCVALVKDDELTSNHKIIFLNTRFNKELGWSLQDIPDKSTWFKVAFPDKDYQKVVTAQWELVIESVDENAEYVSMDVNIKSKFNGTHRYRVYCEVNEYLFDDYYMVFFSPLS